VGKRREQEEQGERKEEEESAGVHLVHAAHWLSRESRRHSPTPSSVAEGCALALLM
jgi:hypothetical protein